MDWERLIPGHPGVGGRLGTKRGRTERSNVFAARIRRGKEGGSGGQVLGQGRERIEAAEVRRHPRLRAGAAFCAAPLLRPLGPRLLSRARPRTAAMLTTRKSASRQGFIAINQLEQLNRLGITRYRPDDLFLGFRQQRAGSFSGELSKLLLELRILKSLFHRLP